MDYNPVGWFEIPVSDMERARLFYETVFATTLTPQEMGPLLMSWFPMHDNAKGAMGALVKNDWYTPSQDGVVVYFTAPDLDDMLVRAEKAGGEIVVPKKDLGQYGESAIVQDTEGNRIGLHRMKKA